MPSVLTHTAIMLLARERLAEMGAALDARVAARKAAGQTSLLMETRLQALVSGTLEILNAPPHVDATVPDAGFGNALTAKVSKFAVMGAMGPDIPAFSNMLRPGQDWLFDTVHKGTPDTQKEQVLARTSDLALDIWSKGQVLLTLAKWSDTKERDEALAKLRAYVLGHLCHTAGDIISHPLINDLEWHLGTDAQDKLEHHDGEGSHDAAVAQRIFGLSGVRGGSGWDGWWPTKAEVPDELYEAYAQALEEIYKAQSNRPKGFSAFETRLTALGGPPVPDEAFIKDGYETYRSAVISKIFSWGRFTWFWVLAIVFVPLLALPFLYLYPPSTRGLAGIDTEVEPGTERLLFTTFTLPLHVCALSALIFHGMVMGVSTGGVKLEMFATLAASIMLVAAAGLFFVEAGRERWPAVPRWLFLFLLPLILLVGLGVAARDDYKKGRKRHMAVYLIPAALGIGPFVAWLLLFGVLKLVTGLIDVIVNALGGDFGSTAVAFWVATVVWVVGLVYAWIKLSKKLRDIRIPEEPASFVATRRHAVRLFDEETLFADPAAAASPPILYPTGRRALARLWWAGPGTMSIRSDRIGLTFRLVEPTGTREQVVPAPIAPMRLTEYLAFLQATVIDSGGNANLLLSRIEGDPATEDVSLPPGATFAAHGDDADTEADVLAGAAEFKELGATEASTKYILHHAPKAWQSIRLGPVGPLPRPFTDSEGELGHIESANGFVYVHEPSLGSRSEALMSVAGDLAALLCLGGTSHIHPPAGQERIFQVFRNWNLDRRRVNEWRALVAGGAWREVADPAAYHPFSPAGAHGPANPGAWRSPLASAADASLIEDGERTASGIGWVQVMRRWTSIMATPGADPLATAAAPDGGPSARDLSRAMAYLLDLPDPATPTPAGP